MLQTWDHIINTLDAERKVRSIFLTLDCLQSRGKVKN